MRFIEIRGSLMVPVSNEEMLLVEKVKGSIDPLIQSKLDEREGEVARQLVHRGVLARTKIDGENCLLYNDLEDIWGN
jgi:hypothetical protein